MATACDPIGTPSCVGTAPHSLARVMLSCLPRCLPVTVRAALAALATSTNSVWSPGTGSDSTSPAEPEPSPLPALATAEAEASVPGPSPRPEGDPTDSTGITPDWGDESLLPKSCGEP